MKILHIQSYYQPGFGYQENCLPKEQVKLGHEVIMVTSERYRPIPNYDVKWEKVLGPRESPNVGVEYDEGVKIYRLPVLFEAKSGFLVYIKNLMREIAHLQPDIVHVHEIISSTFQQILFSSLKLPWVVDCHLSRYELTHHFIRRKAYFLFIRFLVVLSGRRRANRYLAITPDARDMMVEEFGISSGKISMLYLGADHNKFVFSPSKRKSVRDKLYLPQDVKVIIYAGKMEKRKQIEVLLEVFSRIDNKKALLLLVGGGSEGYMQFIQLGTERLNIQERVRIHPFVPNEDLPGYYSAVDVGVWPGSASNTIIEAMSCSLPVIIRDDGSTRHLLDYGGGYRFQRGNVDKSSGYLNRLLIDDGLRKRLGAEARKAVEEYFSWQKIAMKSIEIYDDVLSERT